MNINKILFIGIGQCGNNIINEIDKLGYNTLAINTSELDMCTIEVENKYTIPGANGCARDRKRAIKFFQQTYTKVISLIETQYSEVTIVYTVFSFGGGTGAGIGPILTDVLSSKFRDKYFNIIGVVPSFNDTRQCRINAIDTYNDILKIKNLRSKLIIDNNYSDNLLNLNKELAKLIDSVMKMSNPDKSGVIDEYELEKLLTCIGDSIIIKFSNSNEGNIYSENSIFLDYIKGCKYIGVSMCDNIDTSLLTNEFGEPHDIFKGKNKKENIVIVTGLNYNVEYFNKLDNILSEQQKVEEIQRISIDTSKYTIAKDNIQIKETDDIDFDELFNQYK